MGAGGGAPRAVLLVGVAIVLAGCVAGRLDPAGAISFEGLRQHRQLQQDGLIAGGEPAPCGRYPYMVSLRDSADVHRCGGILIDRRWVLTAAHCIDPRDKDSLGLNPVTVIGDCNLRDTKTKNENGVIKTVRPERAFIHEGYTGSLDDGNDIALLRLRKVDRPKQTPVAMPSRDWKLEGGVNLVALGWGDGKIAELQQAPNLRFIENKFCNDPDLWDGIVSASMMCAFSSGQDVCKGDSGGPLLEGHSPSGNVSAGSASADILVGITSFGELTDEMGQPVECGSSAKPSVFAKVSSFLDWIDAKMKIKDPDPVAEPSPTEEPSEPSEPALPPVKVPQPPPPEPVPEPVPPSPEPAPPSPAPVPSSPAPVAPSPEPVPRSPELMPPSPQPVPPSPEPVPPSPTLAVPSPAPMPPSPAPEPASPPELSQEELDVALILLAGSRERADTQAFVSDYLSRGASPDACCINDLVTSPKTLSYVGQCTAIHATSAFDNAVVASALAAAGADLTRRCQGDWTPLHRAAVDDADAVVEALIAAGADIEARAKGNTPLHEAAKFGSPGAASALVEGGADKGAINDDGQTPAQVICSFAVFSSCSASDFARLEALLA